MSRRLLLGPGGAGVTGGRSGARGPRPREKPRGHGSKRSCLSRDKAGAPISPMREAHITWRRTHALLLHSEPRTAASRSATGRSRPSKLVAPRALVPGTARAGRGYRRPARSRGPSPSACGSEQPGVTQAEQKLLAGHHPRAPSPHGVQALLRIVALPFASQSARRSTQAMPRAATCGADESETRENPEPGRRNAGASRRRAASVAPRTPTGGQGRLSDGKSSPLARQAARRRISAPDTGSRPVPTTAGRRNCTAPERKNGSQATANRHLRQPDRYLRQSPANCRRQLVARPARSSGPATRAHETIAFGCGRRAAAPTGQRSSAARVRWCCGRFDPRLSSTCAR
jgi:hypothetical protein